VSRRLRRRLGTVALLLLLALVASRAGAADDLEAAAFLEVRKTAVGHAGRLIVELTNHGTASLGPLALTVTPGGKTDVTGIIPAGATVDRAIEIPAAAPGVFNVRVRIGEAGRRRAELDAGSFEVVEPPGALRDLIPIVASVIALLGTLATLVVTSVMQLKVLRATREQKAAESVAQIVLAMAREYYGTVSGAISALATAVRRLEDDPAPDEREHLLVRSFFFFGTLLYKDNEFAFSHNVMFLPDLWAEEDVRNLVDDVLRLVPLTRAQEAVVHKAFSDVAAVQRGGVEAATVKVRARNLYDFEALIRDRTHNVREEQRQIQAVFDAVRARFEEPEVVQGIKDVDDAMRAIMEYEFTEMFGDFYGRTTPNRRRPASLPRFDEIVGPGRWAELRRTLDRLDHRRKPGPPGAE
jgi:hypothetical protein